MACRTSGRNGRWAVSRATIIEFRNDDDDADADDDDDDDDDDDADDDDDDDNNNNNNNENNDDDDDDHHHHNRIQRCKSRYFLQSPHSAANSLQHVRSSGPGKIVCKSRTTHGALITCNMSCYVSRGTKGQLSY